MTINSVRFTFNLPNITLRHLDTLLVTEGDVQSGVELLRIPVVTEDLRAGGEILHCHNGHDVAQDGVGGVQRVLAVPPEAVVGLVKGPSSNSYPTEQN